MLFAIGKDRARLVCRPSRWRLRSEVDLIERAGGCNDYAAARKQAAPGAGKLPSSAIPARAVVGNTRDSPYDAAQGDSRVVVTRQLRSGEGQGRLFVAVDHAMNCVGAVGVGSRRGIHTEKHDAQAASFQRDDVNVEIVVALDAL